MAGFLQRWRKYSKLHETLSKAKARREQRLAMTVERAPESTHSRDDHRFRVNWCGQSFAESIQRYGSLARSLKDLTTL